MATTKAVREFQPLELTDLSHETRLSLHELARRIGRHRNTVRYWIKTGLFGVKLEADRVGRDYMTSVEAERRFSRAVEESRIRYEHYEFLRKREGRPKNGR